MLTSLAFIFLCGLFLAAILQKLRLPPLLGMLITGIILGPYALRVIDGSILAISADLRQMALVIILIRAGLSLNLSDLKKVGRPAVLLCFVPACFEIIGIVLLAPQIMGISVLEACVMGSVLAAVSPAVIVPKMLTVMDQGYGKKQGIPQMLLAGASVDDIFVIVLFTSFTSAAQGEHLSVFAVFSVPVSIILGIIIGGMAGLLLTALFKTAHMRDSVKVLILLSCAFLCTALETAIKPFVPFSGLIAVLAMGTVLLMRYAVLAQRLSAKFSKLWVGAEILLFVLVGAAVDIRYAASAGVGVICVLVLGLLFRAAGVWLCMLKTSFSWKERLFCIISYMPKATVQAAIGAVPLAMGLPCGKIVLTAAVLAIFITAPLGAFGIEHTYRKFLQKSD